MLVKWCRTTWLQSNVVKRTLDLMSGVWGSQTSLAPSAHEQSKTPPFRASICIFNLRPRSLPTSHSHHQDSGGKCTAARFINLKAPETHEMAFFFFESWKLAHWQCLKMFFKSNNEQFVHKLINLLETFPENNLLFPHDLQNGTITMQLDYHVKDFLIWW